jgi:AcrR family transcriptional regulator
MARPKSEDKRSAILTAAISVLAERGLAATPTSAISKAAGVAEGTLFTYFKTKDDLVNALYREIKMEMADLLLSSYPHRANVRRKFQHIWDFYVNWGVANPQKSQVMQQLSVAAQITEASRAAGYAPFAELEKTALDAIAARELQPYPVAFIAATMESLAKTTMAFMAHDPDSAERFRASGFDVFWNGIAYR